MWWFTQFTALASLPASWILLQVWMERSDAEQELFFTHLCGGNKPSEWWSHGWKLVPTEPVANNCCLNSMLSCTIGAAAEYNLWCIVKHEQADDQHIKYIYIYWYTLSTFLFTQDSWHSLVLKWKCKYRGNSDYCEQEMPVLRLLLLYKSYLLLPFWKLFCFCMCSNFEAFSEWLWSILKVLQIFSNFKDW